jgi:hypothetical protein
VRCRYTDEIEVEDGWRGAPVRLFIRLIFRHWHRRWHQVTEILFAAGRDGTFPPDRRPALVPQRGSGEGRNVVSFSNSVAGHLVLPIVVIVVPAGPQLGTIRASGQHRLGMPMPTPLRIGCQSIRCQIHCETCQLF